MGVLGWPKPRAMEPMEVVFLQPQARTVYEFSLKQNWDGKLEYVCPARIPRDASRLMRRLALDAFAVFGCRDVARVDFRTDRRGRPFVIELNPLPGMTPAFSDLVMIAEAAGIGYRDLIGRVLECAIRRRKLGLV
ncbi:MAG: hypothetical protein HY905_04590 [Deltaproteobacteria bacterium]|nr:hypothetical protein [Deltaproteobacteria bacterium]